MTTPPRVTVLTAVRNGARYIEQTVASIRQQSCSDWEYLIVDDASTDGTDALVERLIRDDPRIRLIRRESSGGPYVAANEGLRQARGEYVVRTDGDDLSPPHRIQTQLDFLRFHPSLRACISFIRFFRGSEMRADVSTVPVRPAVFRWYLLLRGASTHSSLCIERTCLNELGGYRELPLSQDYRLLCDLSRKGWLGVVPEALSFVRTHEERATVTRGDVQRALALDIVADHLRALTGEVWKPEEIALLYAVGHSVPVPVDEGLAILDRWDRLWRTAPDLTDEDRRELARLSAFRRRKQLRASGRREPVAVCLNLVRLAFSRPGSLFGDAQAVRG